MRKRQSTTMKPQTAGPWTEDSDEFLENSPSSIGTPSRQRASASLPSDSHNKQQKLQSVKRLNLSPAGLGSVKHQKSPSSMRKRQSNQGETPSSYNKRKKSPSHIETLAGFCSSKPQRLLEDTPSASQKSPSSMRKCQSAPVKTPTSSNKRRKSPAISTSGIETSSAGYGSDKP